MSRVDRIIDSAKHDAKKIAVQRTAETWTDAQVRSVFDILLRARLTDCSQQELNGYARQHALVRPTPDSVADLVLASDTFPSVV